MDTQGWIQALKGFAGGGLVGAGVPLPPSIASNPIQQVLQNPDNAAALGMGRYTMTPAALAARAAGGAAGKGKATGLWAAPGAQEKLQAMRAAGASAEDIAKEFGTNANAVYQKIYRMKGGRPPSSPEAPTPTGQPSLPQLQSLAGPPPAEDTEMAKAMADYLAKMGIGQ